MRVPLSAPSLLLLIIRTPVGHDLLCEEGRCLPDIGCLFTRIATRGTSCCLFVALPRLFARERVNIRDAIAFSGLGQSSP
jgi:hypothetical protein